VVSKPPQPPLKTAKAKVKPSGTATVFKTGLRREDNYETGQLESTTDDDDVVAGSSPHNYYTALLDMTQTTWFSLCQTCNSKVINGFYCY